MANVYKGTLGLIGNTPLVVGNELSKDEASKCKGPEAGTNVQGSSRLNNNQQLKGCLCGQSEQGMRDGIIRELSYG